MQITVPQELHKRLARDAMFVEQIARGEFQADHLPAIYTNCRSHARDQCLAPNDTTCPTPCLFCSLIVTLWYPRP